MYGGWGWRGERELDGGGDVKRCVGGEETERDRQTERQTDRDRVRDRD